MAWAGEPPPEGPEPAAEDSLADLPEAGSAEYEDFPENRRFGIALATGEPYDLYNNPVGILSRVAEGIGPETPQQPVRRPSTLR
jgi:hypothetical protein